MTIDLRTCRKGDLLKRRDGATSTYSHRAKNIHHPQHVHVGLSGGSRYTYNNDGKWGLRRMEDGYDIVEIFTPAKPSRKPRVARSWAKWAVVYPDGTASVRTTRESARRFADDMGGKVIRVMVTEIPRTRTVDRDQSPR